jgi:hypothetical protein
MYGNAMLKKTDELLLLVHLWGDNSLVVGPQPHCFTDVPFMGKVYSLSKHYGLVRRKSATTRLVLSLAQESAVDLNSMDRFP